MDGLREVDFPVADLGRGGGEVEIWCSRNDVIGQDGGWRGRRGRLGRWGHRLHWAVRYQTAGPLWGRDRQIGVQTERPHYSSVTASLCLKGLNAPLEPPGKKKKKNTWDFWDIFVRYKKYHLLKLNECLNRKQNSNFKVNSLCRQGF